MPAEAQRYCRECWASRYTLSANLQLIFVHMRKPWGLSVCLTQRPRSRLSALTSAVAGNAG
jgi:hypothetical protein